MTAMLNASGVALTLRLRVLPDEFASSVASEFDAPGTTPVMASERFFEAALQRAASEAFGERLIKAPGVRLYPQGILQKGSNFYLSLPRLREDGLTLWYPEVSFATSLDDGVSAVNIAAEGVRLVPLNYGQGISRTHTLVIKTLKRQINYKLRLLQVELPKQLWADLQSKLKNRDLPQPWIAHPRPVAAEGSHSPAHDVEGYRLVAFDHMVTGERVFCECSRHAHRKMAENLAPMVPSYTRDAWPSLILRQIQQAQYMSDICHMCVGRIFGVAAAGTRYGHRIQDFELAYIDQVMAENGQDKRTTRAEVQRRLGLTKWKREAELYAVVRELFPEETIQREASPSWLGRQRLDIYIPSLKLAFEYQGEQHFSAVNLFGGEEGLNRARERDARKRALCIANGVQVVDVLHSHVLTPATIRIRVRKYLT